MFSYISFSHSSVFLWVHYILKDDLERTLLFHLLCDGRITMHHVAQDIWRSGQKPKVYAIFLVSYILQPDPEFSIL